MSMATIYDRVIIPLAETQIIRREFRRRNREEKHGKQGLEWRFQRQMLSFYPSRAASLIREALNGQTRQHQWALASPSGMVFLDIPDPPTVQAFKSCMRHPLRVVSIVQEGVSRSRVGKFLIRRPSDPYPAKRNL